MVVDLDGTLLRTDTLLEMLSAHLRQHPNDIFRLLRLWFTAGKAALKQTIALEVTLEWGALPFEPCVWKTIEEAKRDGRDVVLATASNETVARAIANHVGMFDEVIASNGAVNLKGPTKATALVERFGVGGFDYIGNDRHDLPVLENARAGFLVAPSALLLRRAIAINVTTTAIGSQPSRIAAWVGATRPHHWIKNLLIMVPAVAAQMLTMETIGQLIVAIGVFSVFASSVYIFNDMLDVNDDRQHPTKKFRPFAAGELGLGQGAAAAAVLSFGSLAAGFVALGLGFTIVLVVYAGLTIAYSVLLKRVALIDVFLLTLLYGLRLLAGAVVISVVLSPWLLSFAFFAFLSLALAKRYVELSIARGTSTDILGSRGYLLSDSTPLMIFGIASAFTAAVVLALYIESATVQALYQRPGALWLAVPMFTFWMSRLWLFAHRGELNHDPVKFALADWPSYVFGVVLMTTWVIAA